LNPQGIDISVYQDPHEIGPFVPQWADKGLIQFGYTRASEGEAIDTHYTEHHKNFQSAQLATGVYHALSSDANQTYAAKLFVSLFTGKDTLPAVVDVESLGNTVFTLAMFIAAYQTLTDYPLMIYTSGYFWHKLIGFNHTEFSKYPLWAASYDHLGPENQADDVWGGKWLCWQKHTLASYLPGFTKDLDIDMWNGPLPGDNMDTKLIQGELDKITTSVGVINQSLGTPVPTVILPPPPTHTMNTLTNQDVINKFAAAFGNNFYWKVLAKADLADIANSRDAVYSGPPVESLALSDSEKAQLIAHL
jgi:GH25 family lysozyme M1 (1,4-beta-N-acetylmuramidase)